MFMKVLMFALAAFCVFIACGLFGGTDVSQVSYYGFLGVIIWAIGYFVSITLPGQLYVHQLAKGDDDTDEIGLRAIFWFVILPAVLFYRLTHTGLHYRH